MEVNDADKQYIINPFLGYSTPGTWSSTYMAFFEKYYSDKAPTAILTPTAVGPLAASTVYYDLAGRRVSKPTKGIYIAKGRKVMVK